jgi:PEP-CTERM motif
MKKSYFLLLIFILFLATPAGATNITKESGDGTLVSYDLSGSGLSTANPWLISEILTGNFPFTLKFYDPTGGSPLGTNSPTFHNEGKWFTKTVLNDTGVTWTSFELELQTILGAPSPGSDGLSFADGSGLLFFSNQFSEYTRIDTTKDYLNFHGGDVLDGEYVTFTFLITDNEENNPFWLLESPNKGEIPEPSTMLLLGFGLAGLGAYRLRKRVSQ